MSQSNKVEQPAQVGQVQRLKLPEQELLQTKPPRSAAGAASSERADILKRVAAFKAHQAKLGEDRKKYYEAVQEKIRTALGNQFKAKRL